jgi:Family of unknown function (DUF5519)
MSVIVLPRRAGPPPTISGPDQHEQLTQVAPPEVQDRLVARVEGLPGVVVGPSFVSVPGSRAFHLVPRVARGPLDAFQAGTEFAHLHPPYDSSLHVCLPPRLGPAVLEKGWGVAHPQSGALLVYGPRDDNELEVAWSLLHASYQYALGPAEPSRGARRD